MPQRVAIYRRVSDREQIEGYSLASQERACREYAERQSWTIVAEYADEGVSARHDNPRKRLQFRQMLQDADNHRFDALIVHKLDRFYRNLLGALNAIDRLEKAGVGLVSISEHIDLSSPQGRLSFNIFAAFAQFYSENLGQETRKGKHERKRQGYYLGPLPFGCVKATNEPGSAPIPDTIPRENGLSNHAGLLHAFEMAAAGHSDGAITTWLNEQGFRTGGNRGRNLWRRDGVRHMLTNRFYVGELPLDRLNIAWALGKHVPIIPSELFERAQAARQRIHKPSTRKGLTFSLSGLLKCAYCLESGDSKRGQIRIHRHTRKGGVYTFVECLARQSGIACPQRSVALHVYEAQIGDWLASLRIDDAAIDRATELFTVRKMEGPDPEIARRRIQERLQRELTVFRLGDQTEVEYRRVREELLAELRALPLRPFGGSDLYHAAEVLREMRELWEFQAPEVRNLALRGIVRYIVVRDGRIERIVVQEEYAALLGTGG